MAKKQTPTSQTRKQRSRIYLPPSGASSWTQCTEQPWFILEHQDDLPDIKSTPQADEGVLAHALGEHLLRSIFQRGYRGGRPPKITETMEEHVSRYVRFCADELTISAHTQTFIEYNVHPIYSPQNNGYIDFVAITPPEHNGGRYRVDIVDLKYGKWKVEAPGNKQMVIYARSLMAEQNIPQDSDWGLWIHQPRTSDGDLSGWHLTGEDLVEWYDEHIGSKVRSIQSRIGTEFKPDDDVCHFCPANTICPAREKHLFSAPAVSSLASTKEIRQVASMQMPPKDKVLAMLPHVKPLMKFLEDLLEHARQMAENGVITPEDGYKLVRGKGSRSWTDPAKVEDTLLELFDPTDVVIRKLLSPAQAEDLCKRSGTPEIKSFIQSLVTRTEGRPLLVPASDDRPAISITGGQLEDSDAALLLDALD